MDDLDDVRAALGFEQVNLNGMSYGTRAALVYARRHPKRVRTMTLQGVNPPTMRLPEALAANQQAALDGVLRDCANDGDCVSRYGDVAATLTTVMDRLRRRSAAPHLPVSRSRSCMAPAHRTVRPTTSRSCLPCGQSPRARTGDTRSAR
jgi:pimeloyl-ACP methyl ester carboxylesterase